MIDYILNLPAKFWQRLGIILFSYLGANFLSRYVTFARFVDPSLLVSILFVSIVLGLVVLNKAVKNNFQTFIIGQLMFFWMILDAFLIKTTGFSFKPYGLVFGFVVFAAFVYFFRYFNLLCKFNIFRYLSVFFIINIIYYFCYHSNFNITLVSSIYNWTNFSENQDAKTIVFLNSLAVLTSSILAISAFYNIKTKEQIDKMIMKTMKISAVAFSLVLLMVIVIGNINGAGYQVYLPIYFLFLLGLKYYIDNNLNISQRYSDVLLVFLIGLFGLTLLSCNKSALISVLLTTMTCVFINFRLKLKFNIFNIIKDKRFGLWFILAVVFVILFVAAKFNIIAVVVSKISDSMEAFQGVTSLYIRKANWKYFLQYWHSHIDSFKVIFGFGLGKSREVMFYSSSMMYSPIYRVQTTHNQYMEMFFDYGLMSLFYYLPLLIIAFRSIVNLFSSTVDKNIKLLSNVSLMLLIFYGLYHTTDGLRVQTAIIFFATLVYLEALKYTLTRAKTDKSSN